MKYIIRLVIGLLLLSFGLAVLAGNIVAVLLFIAYIAVRLLTPKMIWKKLDEKIDRY